MRAKTLMFVFVAAVVIAAANCDPNTKLEPGKTADGRIATEPGWWEDVNGVYKYRKLGDGGDDDSGWSRPQTIAVLSGENVTVFDGKRNVTVNADRITMTYKVLRGGRIGRSLPPDDGAAAGAAQRVPAIQNFQQFHLVPGHSVHLTFEVPLTALLFPSPYYMHMVTGRKCVHLYWTSADRLAYWTTNATKEQPCDPSDGSEDQVEQKNKDGTAPAVTLGGDGGGSGGGGGGGRRKRDGPPADVVYSQYYKSDGPVGQAE